MLNAILARFGFKLTRVLPPPPEFWTVEDGLNFDFLPVVKTSDRMYIVTSPAGRWHVGKTDVEGVPDDHAWYGVLVKHRLDPTPSRVVRPATAADVIARIFNVSADD